MEEIDLTPEDEKVLGECWDTLAYIYGIKQCKPAPPDPETRDRLLTEAARLLRE
jgi:hypothetical protein